jgi:hypothetical protein
LRRGGGDRRRHRPDQCTRPALLSCPRVLRSPTGTTTRRQARGVHRQGACVDGQARAGRWSGSPDGGAEVFDYGTRSAPRPRRAATKGRSSSRASWPGIHPALVL